MQTRHLLALTVALALGQALRAEERSESFDRDPGWDGRNFRSAIAPRTIRQNFGYSPDTSRAGGRPGNWAGSFSAATAATPTAWLATEIDCLN